MLKLIEGKHYAIDSKGCWVWSLGVFSTGYGYVWVNGGNVTASVFSYLLHKGPTRGLMVLHTCDNRRCVNPDHLYLGTHIDNMIDKRRRGSMSSISEEDVRKMRKEYETGRISQRELAKKYGIGQTTVFAIVNRDTWVDV